MTRTLRTFTILLIALFAISVAVVSAQDEVSSSLSEDMSGFIVQPALSGEFVSLDEGAFTLSLESATEFNTWIVSAPSLYTANHSLAEFAGDWSFDEEIVAEGLLQLEDMTIKLTLSTPVYYLVDGTFSFSVTINEIVAESAGKGGPALPETFDGATLIIQLDAGFASNYLTARQARLAETRGGSGQGCEPFPSPC